MHAVAQQNLLLAGYVHLCRGHAWKSKWNVWVFGGSSPGCRHSNRLLVGFLQRCLRRSHLAVLGIVSVSPLVEGRFNRRRVGHRTECRVRRAFPVGRQHQVGLRPTPSLPFLAVAKVPSAVVSSQLICLRPSSLYWSQRQASVKIRAFVQSRCRRWHVEGLGYRLENLANEFPF